MVKLTAILLVLWTVNFILYRLYFSSLSEMDKYRVARKKFTKFEYVWLSLTGLSTIAVLICVTISLIILILKFL